MNEINWSPGIGDPSITGWITVVAYFFCALLACLFFFSSKTMFHHNQLVQRKFWLAVFLIMLILGINKQLDIQSLFTEIGRYLAREQRWYVHRRKVQLIFIASVAVVGFVLLVWCCWFFRKLILVNLLATFGVVILFVFVLVRASSFHGMDRFIGFQLLGLRMNWLLELGGISLVVINQAMHLWGRKERRSD